MDIFLSSTAEDLAEHRLAVKQAIERLELTCVGQETFTADQRRSLDFCRDRVRRCDLVVVIVAHRYGWVPPPGQGGDGRKSITWHEVDAAGETPVLAFVVKSDDDRFRWTHGAESDQLNTATSQAEAAEIFDRIQALKEFKDIAPGAGLRLFHDTGQSGGAGRHGAREIRPAGSDRAPGQARGVSGCAREAHRHDQDSGHPVAAREGGAGISDRGAVHAAAGAAPRPVRRLAHLRRRRC